MDHVVYLDAKAEELRKILAGYKTMLIRGAAGRKMPYGRVNQNDALFLLENDGSGLIRVRAEVNFVLNSDKMDQEQSAKLIADYEDQLQLTEVQRKRWSGKRYLVLIGLTDIEQVAPFGIDKSQYGNMDDWLLVGDIQTVRI